MIHLICTQCQSGLDIDDAFAGGVCRCRFCGTIQTVPNQLKPDNAAGSGAAASAASRQAKSLYRRDGAESSRGSGLDDLAQAMSGSGLGSGLAANRPRPAPPTRAAAKPQAPRSLAPVMAALGGVVALVLVGVLWLGFFRQRSAPAPTSGIMRVEGKENPLSTGFYGVVPKGSPIIFVLDRGDASKDVYGEMLDATFRTIGQMRGEQKFMILFWNNGSDLYYPTDGPTFATAANLQAARKALEWTYASGQTDVSSALAKALSYRPSAIILATGKGWDLGGEFEKTVLDLWGKSITVIHTFSLGVGDPSPPLEKIAQTTGGQFRAIPKSALRVD